MQALISDSEQNDNIRNICQYAANNGFSDVAIFCEDGEVEPNKLLLASISDFLSQL